MAKQLFKVLALVAVSLIGGLLGGQLAVSYLIGELSFGDQMQGPVVVAQKQETVIRENEAIVEVIAKVSGIAVNIQVTGAGGAQTSGSGVIITSDGMAAIPYGLYPPGSQAQVTVGGKKTSFTVLQRDKASNIAVLKLDGSNWPTAGFASADDIKLGQRVFMVGTIAQDGNFANEGIIRSIAADLIGTNITETIQAAGSAILDIEGNIIGISIVDKSGFINIIPISKIKEIAGL